MPLIPGTRFGPYAVKLGRIGVAAAILALLLLDFAAVDDIATGNEPNFYAEDVMLGNR